MAAQPHTLTSRIDSADPPGRALQQHLPANTGAPRLAGEHLRAWLTQQDWPSEDTADLVAAVSEAVTNAVEHAYLDERPDHHVTVAAAVLRGPNSDGTRRVVISVTDRGSWRPPPARPEFRGRGLARIRALTASLELTANATGTRVKLISRPTPPNT